MGFHHYLPIPDDIFHGGFYLTSAGRSLVQPGEEYPPSPHPPAYQFSWDDGRVFADFSFILIEEGRGVFESKPTGRVLVQAGMAILLFPGVWHRYRPSRKTGWLEAWMQFNGESAHAMLDRGLISPEHAVFVPAHPSSTRSALHRLLARIHADAAQNSSLFSMRAMGVLAEAIGEDPRPKSAIAHQDPLVAAALAFIWTSSHRVLSVEDVASAVGVKRRRLERHMARIHGATVLEEIVRCRVNRAKRLLSETDLPIKTVVALAGFGSTENMRRQFLAETGLPPAAFRRADAQASASARSQLAGQTSR